MNNIPSAREGVFPKICPKCDYASQVDWYLTRWHQGTADCGAMRAKDLELREHLHHYCVKCGFDFVGKVFPK